MERQMVGEGSYGCVHRPALRCEKDKDVKGKTVDYTDTISKISEPYDAFEEIKQYDAIEKVDKEQKYYTGTPVMCIPKIDAEFNRAVDKCLIKGHQYKNGRASLIVMKDGGEDLGKFAQSLSKMNPTDPNSHKVINDFWIEMARILEGLQLFIKKKVIHYDLKEGNIVYDTGKQRANFIDFGTLTEKKKVAEDAKQGYCSKCIRHWSYPFENHFLNKDAFIDEYQQGNAQMFLTTLNDVFTVGFDPDEDLDVKIRVVKNRGAQLLDKAKHADEIPLNELNQKSHIVLLFGELKSPNLPHLLADFLKEIQPFFQQHNEWTYETFVEKSLNTVDIFGVGIAFLYVLKYAKPFMSPAFFDDLYKLSFRMITPNLKERYTITPLLADYKKLLKKHIPDFNPSKKQVVLSQNIKKGEKKNKADCPEGKIRNPATGRCIKDNTAALKAPLQGVLKDCPEGKVLNPKTGRCIKNKTRKSIGVINRPARTTRVLTRTTRVLSRTTRVLTPRS